MKFRTSIAPDDRLFSVLRGDVEEEKGLGVAWLRWKPLGATTCGYSVTSWTCVTRASAATAFEEHDVRKERDFPPLTSDVWGPTDDIHLSNGSADGNDIEYMKNYNI
jgi:hypothetical protein